MFLLGAYIPKFRNVQIWAPYPILAPIRVTFGVEESVKKQN